MHKNCNIYNCLKTMQIGERGKIIESRPCTLWANVRKCNVKCTKREGVRWWVDKNTGYNQYCIPVRHMVVEGWTSEM